MTSLQEAIKWLADNAPNVTFRDSYTHLAPGKAVGEPTIQIVRVYLAPRDDSYSVAGEGATILEAVQNAVGATR